MDRKSVLAVIIITIIIIMLPWYYQLIHDEQVPDANVVQKFQEQKELNNTEIPYKETIQDTQEISKEEKVYKKDSVEQYKDEKYLNIETPLIKTRISNRGGGKFLFWNLKKYSTWQDTNAQIINEEFDNGVNINFLSVTGNYIDLGNFLFQTEQISENEVKLSGDEKYIYKSFIDFNGARIEKTLTFYADKYHVDLSVSIFNSDQLLLNREYQIGWINGLPSNEKNEVEDYTYSEAYANMAGERESFDIESEEPVEKQRLIGTTDWIAIRTKYFLSAIIPNSINTEGVEFGGRGIKIGDVVQRRYDTFLSIQKSNNLRDDYKIYLGPLDHSILSDYEKDLEDIVLSHGWYETTFRAISLPLVGLLKFLYTFIPNYGIVIIIFSILVKIVVYPLTKKSYKSMKEMSRVQPLLAELREKYKGDPQRLNRETMKLYKEHGINPLGGCLPMLLQLPLLAALFIVFRSTIQLRGASFIPGWIPDLSSPDTIFYLPFSLPLYGDQFNILPILMAGSMIFQSKMTMQDPKQKAMVYIMPIFMLLIFNQFPSGLNLYYTLFNLWTIIQQKFIDDGAKPIPVKKK